MSIVPLDQARLDAGLAELRACDPRVAQALASLGLPQARVREPGFSTLLQIITAQQVSTKAAAAIWKRIADHLGEVDAPSVAALDVEDLRALGLSRQKAGYAKGLAEAVTSGALDLGALSAADDETVIAELTALKGFGRWSAEIYLLFALGRTDAWPADDLAIQVGLQRLLNLAERPRKRAQMDELVEHWRPWRGCGALLLWHVYGAATLDAAKDQT